MIKNKVAIVTGAAQGIGNAIAKMYMENGATVYIGDINSGKAAEAAEALKQSTGGKAYAMGLDVSAPASVNAFVQAVMDREKRIDILVNNAGILIHCLLLDMKVEDWDRIFAVNVRGTFLMTQAVGRIMKAQRSGKIINMSSCSGKKPTFEEAGYCSTKSAIIGFTRVTALELGIYGINCNAICPGATDTEMIRSTFLTSPEIEQEWIDKTALKRLGQPEDQAKVALFLASNLSDHITGEALIVAAGEIMGQ